MKPKYLVTAAATVILVGLGSVVFMSASQSEDTAPATVRSENQVESNAPAQAENTPPANGESGKYVEYSSKLVSQASAKQDVVLFFHADWCPTCRGLDANIEQNLSQIPGNLTILKVDYDTAEELKERYKISAQHTLVQVNSQGEEINQWYGSPTLDDVVAQVQ